MTRPPADAGGLAVAVGLIGSGQERGEPIEVVGPIHAVDAGGRGQEAEGGGFREVIGRALIAGIPVLTTVSQGNLDAFLDFAEGLAAEVAADPAQAIAWCLAAATDTPPALAV